MNTETAFLETTAQMAQGKNFAKGLKNLSEQLCRRNHFKKILFFKFDNHLIQLIGKESIFWDPSKSGAVSWILKNKKTILINDLSDKRLKSFYPKENWQRDVLFSYFKIAGIELVPQVYVPVEFENRIIGIFMAENNGHKIETKHILNLEEDVLRCSWAIGHALTLEKLRIQNLNLDRQTRAISEDKLQLEALFEISKTITSTIGFEKILETVVRDIQIKLKFDRVILYTIQESTNTISAKFLIDRGKKVFTQFNKKLEPGNGVVVDVALLQKPVLITHSSHLPERYLQMLKSIHSRQFLMLPLIYNNKCLGVLGLDNNKTQRPITHQDQKRLELFAAQVAIAMQNSDQLIQAAKLQVMGEMTASMVHEVKNPLTGIAGFTELLKASPFSSTQKEVLNALETAVNHLQTVVLNFLSFTKKNKSDLKEIDLRTAVQNAHAITKHHLMKSKIDCLLKIPSQPVLGAADQSQLVQVLINLILNAAQAMPQGGKMMLTLEKNKKNILIRVKDTGVGMNAQKLKNLFEAFHTTKPSGTGLGLRVSYNLIKNMGGEITVKSAVGKGTEFIISF
jgi:signal transduction histidine kinase